MSLVSVYIIAYNEAEKVRATIESARWADEIIVVDSWSTDGTAEIAQSLGARVVQVTFNGFGDLRNHAIEACSHDWIFSLDADERCTPEAAGEIRAIVTSADALDAYWMPRRNYFMGRWIKHSGWHPNYRQPQLFRKGCMTYDLKPVHEGYILNSSKPIGHLKNAIWQFPFKNMAEVMHKANRYSSLGAEKIKHKKISMGSALAHACWSFAKHYVFKRGFLDGWAGFVIALGNFEGTFYRYVKALEMQKGTQWQAPSGVKGLMTTVSGKQRWNIRLALVCFSAASVGFPIAWISLGKVIVLVAGLGYLIASLARREIVYGRHCKRTATIIVTVLLAFLCSQLWTPVDGGIALLALAKHAKLLVILMLITLIRTQQEARAGVIAFVAAQSFVLVSSWLLAAGLLIPWVTDPIGNYVVFSSYLDQSIMLATTAAVIWHLRNDGLWPAWLASVLSVAALADTLLLLDGRSGYAVAITMLTLAAVWAMPKRFRLTALIATPILVLSGLYLGSDHIQDRIALIIQESRAYTQKVETDTSSGWRLNAWQRSIQAIQEQPVLGHGVGSWAVTVKRLQGETGAKVFGEGNASNPHQEFLLWGVELGLGGLLLLIALMVSVALDARRFTPGVQKALWSVISALAVACLFNSSLYDDLIGDFFCVVLGILLAMGIRHEPLPKVVTL